MKLRNKTLLLSLFFSSIATASTDMIQFDNAQQESDYQALIQELRCPQCQNNNIADSNATIATDMRHKTLELLKQGKNKNEVVEYMVERYGNFVTYDPPMTPATLFLWLLPALLLLLGIAFIFKRKKNISTTELQENAANLSLDQTRLNDILNHKEK